MSLPCAFLEHAKKGIMLHFTLLTIKINKDAFNKTASYEMKNYNEKNRKHRTNATANELCHRKTQIKRVKTSSVLKMVGLQT